MNRWLRFVPISLAALAFAAAPALLSQGAKPAAKEMPHRRVALYRVAAGKQLDFLKWLAANDAIDKEAGVPAAEIYAHTDGDSWDYMQIAPDTSKEQQAKVDEVAKKHGMKTGFASSLEFRTVISSHTDTFAIGPVSAADLVSAAAQ